MQQEPRPPERATEVDISVPGSARGNSLTISGDIPTLHEDPERIHQLLDLLDMPKGTQVRVTTVASSVIVR